MTVMTASERGIRADGAMSKLSRIRAIVAASSGNLVEWYDFYASGLPRSISRPTGVVHV
jgi:hypothetical protein